MFNQLYSCVQGQMTLIADASLLLVVLLSGIDLSPKLRFWSFVAFGLCWCVIVVEAVAETVPPTTLR